MSVFELCEGAWDHAIICDDSDWVEYRGSFLCSPHAAEFIRTDKAERNYEERAGK